MTPTEINSACAERIGWQKCASYIPNIYWVAPDVVEFSELDLQSEPPDFHGSTDAAMQLVKRAKDVGYSWQAFHYTEEFQTAFYTREHRAVAYNATLAAAICEAFLKLPFEPKV